jgi:hypothetical protein
MRKLKLDLNALAVESFRTASQALAQGTVQAHQEQVVDTNETYAESEVTLCTCASGWYSLGCSIQPRGTC